MSVLFDWNADEFDSLVSSCELDTTTPYILQYISKTGLNVEAGCGLARYVDYLARLGYTIVGIELNPETVEMVHKLRPRLDVRRGDVLDLEFADGTVGGLISLGVVEHFIDGPQTALGEALRVLQPGAHAVITVPSFNHLRRLKYRLGPIAASLNLDRRLRQSTSVRRLLGRKPIDRQRRAHYTYNPGSVPFRCRGSVEATGFFEYLFTPQEFEAELIKAGFEVIESVPVATMDGIYHELGRRLVGWHDWKFYPSTAATVLDRWLRVIPFAHNHMHLCVVRKPQIQRTGATC
jgi:SAM-dependent methyltransferase